MTYFVLDRFGAKHPCRWIDDWPYIKGVSWTTGARHRVEIPEPLEFPLKRLLNSSGHGPEMPEYFKGTIPLFRQDLVDALVDAGVDNMDLYATRVTDPNGGAVHTNYKAVNLLGLVKAADLDKSIATVHDGSALIDVDFDELVVDEERTRGVLMFRLAESTNAILVHEKLRDSVIKAGFNKLEFLNPKETAL